MNKQVQQEAIDWHGIIEQVPPEQYDQFLQYVELDSLSMTECSAKFKAKTDANEILLTPDYQTVFVRDDGNHAVFRVRHTLTGYQKKKVVLSFTAAYEVLLTVNQEVPDAFFHLYSRMNLVMQTYPFFREWVSSTSSRMPITPILMPLLKPKVVGPAQT